MNYKIINATWFKELYWTKTAAYCYSIGCMCEKRSVFDNLETPKSKCRMKQAVIELVKKCGKPKEKLNEI